MRPSSIVLALALAATACGRPAERTPSEPATPTPVATTDPNATPTPAAAAAPTAGAAATPAAADTPAAPPAPPPSALELAKELVAVEPAGELPLSPETETVVDPAATFRVVLGARFADARLQLLDRADAAIPAAGTREVGATTVLTLAPSRPLVPGSRYHLRLDGDRTRDLLDDAGGVHGPFTVDVLAAGTPPPPEPAKKGRRR